MASPDVDETPLPAESPRALANRLAVAKARDVAHGLPDDAWALGSDQVADLDGVPLGKPGGRDAAIGQLRTMSGRTVRFHTALCLAHADGRVFTDIDLTEVQFRLLDDAAIERYVDAEQPYDCAGSFKSEGLGMPRYVTHLSDEATGVSGSRIVAAESADEVLPAVVANDVDAVVLLFVVLLVPEFPGPHASGATTQTLITKTQVQRKLTVNTSFFQKLVNQLLQESKKPRAVALPLTFAEPLVSGKVLAAGPII